MDCKQNRGLEDRLTVDSKASSFAGHRKRKFGGMINKGSEISRPLVYIHVSFQHLDVLSEDTMYIFFSSYITSWLLKQGK